MSDTHAIYEAYKEGRDSDRDDPLVYPVVAFNTFAAHAALYEALGRNGFVRGQSILDVGGGAGSSLAPYIALGCPLSSMTSIDNRPEQTAEGKERLPGVEFLHCDARAIPFADRRFDVVNASTTFHQILDEAEAEAAGREMRRVCRGHIIVSDWSAKLRRQTDRVAITPERIERYFGMRPTFTLGGAVNSFGARKFLNWMPAALPLLRWLPFGMKVYVLHATSMTVM